MILLLCLLLTTAASHLIISVTPSNSQVSATDLIAIKILTNASISTGALSISFTTDFSIGSPCFVENVTSSCTYSTTSIAKTVVFSASSFSAGTYYTLSISVTNPIFATNFMVSASAGSTAFSNTGLVTITPKTITCSMSSSSSVVGDVAVGYFSIGNDALPANSVMVINSSLQTTFSNLFVSSPSCNSSGGSVPCSLSSSFGQQFLTISGLPTSANLFLNVSSVNNAPYNSSLISIFLQIQNQNGYYMQVCSFSQPAPTTLRTSTSVDVQNWNSSVGAISNVTITINTYFTPFTTKMLWVYDQNFTVSALSPSSSTSLSVLGNNSLNYMAGGVASGKTLSFLAQVTNPNTRQPVVFSVYVIYSSSIFVEEYKISYLALSQLALGVALSLSVNKAMSLSVYNCSVDLPYSISGNPIVAISIKHGEIQCGSLGLASNSVLTVVNCSSSMLALTSASFPLGNFWISFNVLNYYSLLSDNLLTLAITGAGPSYYSMGTGSADIILDLNTQAFTIVNSNTTFSMPTSFTISEGSVLLTSAAARTFTIMAPGDLQFMSGLIIEAVGGATTVLNYSAISATTTISVSVAGPLNIKVSNISNPIKYLGSLLWVLIGTDLAQNPSSFSSAIQSPQYTAAKCVSSIELNTSVIQSSAWMTLTVIPSLQYQIVPSITVTIPNSLIEAACTGCTLLSATTFSFAYSTAIMKVGLRVKNSKNPVNNSYTVVISTTNVTFQSVQVNYTLSPMTYGYVAEQIGFFGQLGTVNITITSAPTTPLTLTYSNLTGVLSGAICTTCSNTQIIANGIIQYFQIASVALSGSSNGVIYATATAQIYYVCSTIQGCRICQSTSGSLTCQLCFTSTYTTYNLLYKNQCLQQCPLATYSNGVTCLDCSTNCQQCNSNGCQLCVINYYVYNGSCLTSCPEPLVSNGTHCIPVPIICPSHCASCPLNNVCLACEGGYLLLKDVCYSNCPSSYVKNAAGTGCDLFIPPEQTSYFPFAFVLSAVLLTIALSAIKCYQKRSLVMGNLIAFLSMVQMGSMIMTLVYTFHSGTDLLVQALIFILLLSKVLLNLIFLVYFLKVVAEEEDFLHWRQSEDSHERLYRVLIVMSSLLSFQCIRLIYSRLMGLRLFFGKFNTSLIFKPLNFFTIASFCTCSFALVFLSVRNIVAQDGYKTSTFYSSVESILIEALLLICCVIDNKKGYDDEFFQYQVYKVKNQFQSSHIEPIEIEEQAENGGSMHEMLNAVGQSAISARDPKYSQIIKNPMWVRRVVEPSMQDVEVQMEDENQNGKQQVGLIANLSDKKRQSLFRRRIIDEWRELQKTLPRHISSIRRLALFDGKDKKLIVPKSRQIIQKSIKRSASLQSFEVKLPQWPVTVPEKIKQYFYNLSVPSSKEIVAARLHSKSMKRRQQRKFNKNRRFADEEQDHSEVKSQTMRSERDDNSRWIEVTERMICNQKEEVSSEKEESRIEKQFNIFVKEPLEIESRENEKQQIDELQEYFQRNEKEASQPLSNEVELEFKENMNKGKILSQFKSDMNLNKEQQKQLASNRYNEVEEKGKRYRVKKRRINRQTQSVYLQRLVGSSDKKVRPRTRNIEF